MCPHPGAGDWAALWQQAGTGAPTRGCWCGGIGGCHRPLTQLGWWEQGSSGVPRNRGGGGGGWGERGTCCIHAWEGEGKGLVSTWVPPRCRGRACPGGHPYWELISFSLHPPGVVVHLESIAGLSALNDPCMLQKC